MRLVEKAILALALVATVSCNTLVGSQREQTLWEALDIQNYDFVYGVSCFCGFTRANPAKLSVRGGVVVKVVPVDSAGFAGTIGTPASYPTVDSVFAILERARKNTPAKLNVEYDPTYHFPKKIFVDAIKNAIDDEVTYTIEKFTPVIGSGI